MRKGIMLWTVPTAGSPVKAEYSYTGRLWADPNSSEAISVLAIPGLVTCLMRSAGRRGKTTARSGAARGRAWRCRGLPAGRALSRTLAHVGPQGVPPGRARGRSTRDVAQLG